VVLGGWLLLSVILSGAGVFQARAGSFPWILLAVAVPMAAGAAFLVLSPAARRLSAAIPAHWAIAAQTPRVIGVVLPPAHGTAQAAGRLRESRGLG
jgi:hypothetical protein